MASVEGVTFNFSVSVEGNEKLREEVSNLLQQVADKLFEQDGIGLVKMTKSKYTISDIRDTPPRTGK
jgi:hypothetical protein